MGVPLLGPALHRAQKAWPDEPKEVQIAEAISFLIGRMVADVIEETSRRLRDLQPAHADAIRQAGSATAAFSNSMTEEMTELRRFLFTRMYRHHKVNQVRSQAKRIVRELFNLYTEEPEILPPTWFDRLEGEGEAKKKRVVCDYIAGMTDRFAINEHKRLFDLSRSFM
jgi:dGTPase